MPVVHPADGQRSAPAPCAVAPHSIFDAIGTELGFRMVGPTLATGPCPECSAPAVAWSVRRGQRDNAYACLHCQGSGSLYRLWRLTVRSDRRAA
jgi:hypothetical protein